MPDGDVRAIGTVICAHGAPLTVAIDRGQVNIAGRMLSKAQCEDFAQLLVRACWEAGEGHA